MVIQILLKIGTMMMIIMPGVNFAYGECGVAGKVRAFIWSLFLLVGPAYRNGVLAGHDSKRYH